MHTVLYQESEAAAAGFRAMNPASEAQYRTALASMPGGNTRSVLFHDPFPLAIARGAGTYLWDLDGHRYVDFLGEYTAGIYGHSHPVILSTIRDALEQGLNLSSHTRGEADLTRAICARFPGLDTVRLTNSGTEANIMALSAARAFTKRRKIMVFAGGYHGGPLSFVGKPSKANVPFDVVIAAYNDLDSTGDLMAQNARDVAAVLVEPMLGAGGCIPGSRAFLQGLRDLCDDSGALLIFDEVMTSRLHPNGFQAQLGIRPDLTTMGKYIGGGMPIGVFGGRADIMAQFDLRSEGHLPHAGTFNNNVLSMRAGLVGLTEIYTETEAARLTRSGAAFRNRLNDICKASGLPVRFSGIGSVMNLHAQAPAPTLPEQVANESGPLKELIFFGLLRRGFLIARRGLVCLNICHTERHLSAFEQSFKAILEDVTSSVSRAKYSGDQE